MHFPARLRWLWLTLAIVILDRATKAWFEVSTEEGWRHEVIHHFIYLVHSTNPGIAFSFFADSTSPWLKTILIAGSIIVACILTWLLVAGKTGGPMTFAGLALLIAGAAGNVTDRILHGVVTDFLEVWIGSYRWPAFNVADSAITIGAILVILDVLFGAKVVAPVGSSRKRV
ncbi:MAG: signal peptidase II [Acidobacteriota bacterium]|nr:signal peptidase II [Acidobacteriota bacterium]